MLLQSMFGLQLSASLQINLSIRSFFFRFSIENSIQSNQGYLDSFLYNHDELDKTKESFTLIVLIRYGIEWEATIK